MNDLLSCHRSNRKGKGFHMTDCLIAFLTVHTLRFSLTKRGNVWIYTHADQLLQLQSRQLTGGSRKWWQSYWRGRWWLEKFPLSWPWSFCYPSCHWLMELSMSFPMSGNNNRRQQCMTPYPFLRQFDVASSRCLDDLGEKENKFQLYDKDEITSKAILKPRVIMIC